ncbi:uncharacterized protein PITG_08180 [Phytophthora infestans T30-4]|uniref:Uncharacterized protein n=1 Tax=Phytophthora infestans (strain T30-4) TaxID=403677 RepID=D0N9N2_PHYIT|nr:uncharacterized protein PITG_08180 [Phytophthora infestans T30-4]EEY54520.1 hypothetical protein PITG_08180 [Phytophthora infestans T30-4]|eukprot:XP_002904342.1 hypothetical protein PITG_08180 [Phytophthora infestans T30-4]
MPKASYGSATTKQCELCEKAISRTNFSKHKKRCKGINVRDSRSDIRKRSWNKHRDKRVGEQRNRRASNLFEET